MKTYAIYLHKLLFILLFLVASTSVGTTAQLAPDTTLFPVTVKEPSPYFSQSYSGAKRLFLHKAQAVGAKMFHLPLKAKGTNNMQLSIDIAWIGNPSPKKILVHSSGLHGVEGFAGSAIQIALLNGLPEISSDGAIILVHIINPYGMDWLRRFNESNVDLNRNCNTLTQNWEGTSDDYHELNDFLNPPEPPSKDCFMCQLAHQLIRIGPDKFREAVASGQSDYPKGLFFRGRQLEEGPMAFRYWLSRYLKFAEQIVVIDVHTGLGKFGQNSLFHKIRGTESIVLSNAIKEPLPENYSGSDVVGYAFKGGLCELYEGLFPEKRIDFLTQEFGTYSKLNVLDALRAENQDHHYGNRAVDSWEKTVLKDTFYPNSPKWRKKILIDGLDLAYRASLFLFED